MTKRPRSRTARPLRTTGRPPLLGGALEDRETRLELGDPLVPPDLRRWAVDAPLKPRLPVELGLDRRREERDGPARLGELGLELDDPILRGLHRRDRHELDRAGRRRLGGARADLLEDLGDQRRGLRLGAPDRAAASSMRRAADHRELALTAAASCGCRATPVGTASCALLTLPRAWPHDHPMRVHAGELICATFVIGCASTLSERASMIQWAGQPQQVAGCRHLGIVEGISRQTGVANISTGRNNARNEALENAANRGATHIHWLSNDESFSAIHITAEAFDCSSLNRDASEAGAERTHDPVVVAASPSDKRREAGSTISTGTCFFASTSGLALSSLHVVKDHSKIVVLDAQGRRSRANVLAKDEQLDLVALQVDLENAPQTLALAAREASLGDAVFTIGFPEVVDLGFEPKLTEGSISGERGLGLDFLLQVSTPVQPGNSGGALVSDSGNVVGIVALRQNFFSDGSTAVNTAFAVKATSIRKAFRSLTMSSIKPAQGRKEAIERARTAACLVIAADDDLSQRR